MNDGHRFPFVTVRNASGQELLRPYIPITLHQGERSINANRLLDTGADVNVLPYRLGIELGAIWDEQRPLTGLSGNLANFAARALIVSASVQSFAPVTLVFAWKEAEHVPLILGQLNFFHEFNVCFFRSQGEIEVRRR